MVKFAHEYSFEGRNALSHTGPPLAPKLWHCARVESGGMLYVVAMDFVAHRPRRLSRADCASFDKAVQVLHNRNLVFGGLRKSNVLLRPNGGLMLIDFDWCGTVGEARYPYDIQVIQLINNNMPWHWGVQPGGLITKEHDEFLLEGLIQESEHS
ncbi:uncharacterized protein PHACADRAFT_185780 [Phanerochaete carnosa HHB-10118-sp]|uniref:Protein kinase domain-containing protein n=1 Tax=Phanerochaete carnosa (strain HHB-10118-sp) TaxID=650164 RepID=K5WRF5_PHACS|nr:uncharacterized protein PHACADRAFT_185780 [Phanerochaete carnosa HHB-10118-sp]EKM52962.1 hypothetical protein PHACADRAFT_185780 [Phanerochaete carnosa HHB-10118-sp]